MTFSPSFNCINDVLVFGSLMRQLGPGSFITLLVSLKKGLFRHIV